MYFNINIDHTNLNRNKEFTFDLIGMEMFCNIQVLEFCIICKMNLARVRINCIQELICQIRGKYDFCIQVCIITEKGAYLGRENGTHQRAEPSGLRLSSPGERERHNADGCKNGGQYIAVLFGLQLPLTQIKG